MASADTGGHRVTPLELFFDLIWVFALTQVTTFMSRHSGWSGIGRGLLLLSVLWWAWVGYSWLTNEIDPEEGGVRLAMFAAMAALVVSALAAPGAFGADALLFAVALVTVRVLQLVLYATVPDAGVRQAVSRLAVTSLAGAALLIAAAFVPAGAPRDLLWCGALAVDLGGPAINTTEGWRVSPGHFAERYGLIVLIALGESVVSIGAASGRPTHAGTIAAGLCGLALAAALWWAYFDVVALVAERRLRTLEGDDRNRMARDSYSYLHLLLVAGIVLVALAVKHTVASYDTHPPLLIACALCGGVALYLGGHVLFRLRNVGTVNRQRVVAGAGALALIPVAASIPALAALACVAVLACGLIAYEALRFAEARARVRHADPG